MLTLGSISRLLERPAPWRRLNSNRNLWRMFMLRHPVIAALRTAVAVLLLAGATLTSAQQGDVLTRDLTVVQRPLAELAPPQHYADNSDYYFRNLRITAWVDHSSNTYRPGDIVTLSVKANQDAYLTILDVGTSGRVHMIFPNRFQRDNRIRAGQIIQVPSDDADFDFQVSGPVGSELVKIIATQYPNPLFEPDTLEPVGPYRALTRDAPTIARDLSVVLRDQQHNQWAAYNKIIRIAY